MDIVSLEEQPKKRAKADNNKEAEVNVEEERDVVAVTPTSPTFPEEILEKIFLKWEQVQYVKAAFGKVFPMIFPLLGREDILNCRLVCKSWASTVDILLQTRPYNRVWERYPLAPSSSGNGDGLGDERKEPVYAPVFRTNLVMKDLGPLCLHPTAKLNKYLKEMTGHAANPLLLRSVELTNEEEDLQAEKVYWNTVLVFLSAFGHHIWNVVIGLSVHDRNDPTYNYSMFLSALTLMPNLKFLCLIGFETGQRKQKRYLTEYIQRFPLPELPNLEGVETLLRKGSKHRPVMDEIMRRYFKLNRIRTKVSFLRPSNIYNCPHLTHLSLKIDKGPEFWKAFCATTLKAPNLARLDLIVASKLKLSTLLKPLRFNFPALEYLKFRFLGQLTDFSEPNLPRFFLEKIKTLEVFNTSQVVYEQIIAHMPGLEYVLVCSDKKGRQEEDMEEQLQIRDYILSEAMYKCDIWLKMKHLKSFTIARSGRTEDTETEIIPMKTYTRDEYILHNEKARE